MKNKQKYIDYVDRMKKIRILSTPELTNIEDENEYSKILVENFSEIGKLAKENRIIIDELIKPYLNSNKLLNDEVKNELLFFSKLLVDDFNFDEVDVHLSELLDGLFLENDIKNTEITDTSSYVIVMGKKIKRDYFLLSSLTRFENEDAEKIRFTAINNVKELLKYYEEDRFLALNNDARKVLVHYSIMGALLYENNFVMMPKEYWEDVISNLRLAEEVFKNPFYKKNISDFDFEAFEFRLYYYGAFLAYSRLPKEIAEIVYEYANRAIAFHKKTNHELIKNSVNLDNLYDLRTMAGVQAGIIQNRVACDNYYNAYKKRNKNDYSIKGINENLDTPSLFFIVSKYTNLELNLEDGKKYKKIEKDVLNYLYKIPKRSDKYLKCITLLTNFPLTFREVNGAMTFEEFTVSAFAAAHPPTFVHINMVANITKCLVTNLLNINPALFIGFPGYNNVEDCINKKEEIINYSYHAGLCHDIGKIFIIDIISMYGRNLLDDEFEMIKKHPVIGAEIALEHNSTKDYADVIKGHHRFYDCSKGYPQEFNTFESPYKTIIDIVAASDCLDAATDTVGRSYSKGITLEKFIEELKDSSGTRYAPFLIDLFENQNVKKEITNILTNKRQKLYKDTFKLLKKNDALI